MRRVLFGLGLAIVALAGLELALRGAGAVAGVVRTGHAAEGGGGGAGRTFTILCVGDSWTQGAPDGRYPEFLVALLGQRHPGVLFRQINVGRAGTNSSQALDRLPQELADYHPDLVLVLTGNNDHHNLTASHYWLFADHRLGGSAMLAARLRVFGHSLRVWRLASTLGRELTGRTTSNEFFEAASPGDDHGGLVAIDRETHRKQLEYNLTRFVELCRREDVPLVFQTYFHFHGYNVNEIVRDMSSRLDVPLVDNNLLFHTAIPVSERGALRIPDGHPNAKGYAWLAQNVAAVLEERGLVP